MKSSLEVFNINWKNSLGEVASLQVAFDRIKDEAARALTEENRDRQPEHSEEAKKDLLRDCGTE